MDSTLSYIESPKDYIRSLLEKAYGASIAKLRENWKEYECFGLDDPKRSMLGMAYHYAQDFKDELDFYDILVFYYIHIVKRHLSKVKLDLYNEALSYCHSEDLIKRIKDGISWCEEDYAHSQLTGFSEEAAKRIEGIDLYFEKIGHKASLHDAYVRSIQYDRENRSMTMVIDTWSSYEDDEAETQLLTIEFSDIVTINMDVDPGNDYAWEFRCYIDNTFIHFELNSAHIEVMCRNMKIVNIENIYSNKTNKQV